MNTKFNPLNWPLHWHWFGHKEQEHAPQHLPVTHGYRWRYQDYAPMALVHQEIDRIFSNIFKGFGVPTFTMPMLREANSAAATEPYSSMLQPLTDIAETDQEYIFKIEIPGVEENQLSLKISGNTLIIHGKKQDIEEEKKYGITYHHIERTYGSFERILSLPDNADKEAVSAEFTHGLLRITIPKQHTELSKGKKIPINT